MADLKPRMTQKGQVTVPVAVRRALGLKPRDRVEFAIEDGRAVLRKAASQLLASYGAVPPRQRPEDFRALREEYEQGVADEVLEEASYCR